MPTTNTKNSEVEEKNGKIESLEITGTGHTGLVLHNNLSGNTYSLSQEDMSVVEICLALQNLALRPRAVSIIGPLCLLA